MKLKSLNNYIGLLICIILFLPLSAEEEIDIWNKEKIQNSTEEEKVKISTNQLKKSNALQSIKLNNDIQIENELLDTTKKIKIFGIYDPAENDFNLNMWSSTNAEDIRASIKRINKINLSNSSRKLFEKTFFSYSFPPKDMNDDEFIDLKIDWMINNKRSDIIEKFLKQNNTFHNKHKVIQYLVDENISKANIQQSCEKINFLDKNIKDAYLEKFKIYCLIFNDKKNEAQLLYDILKEQKQSDTFFDDKFNFLLGITSKTTNKVNEENLLNFYLSSITIKNFKFEPTKKTKKIIWEYLNAANLIELEDVTNKEKLRSLEIAANQDQFDKKKIFDIYKQIPFDLNVLINADNIYQTLESSDSRALIYQKYLLSDNLENKIKLLFLLEELFKKDSLTNVFSEFLSERLKEIDLEDLSDSYKEVVKNNIISSKEVKLGKIKYDDKVLHQSRILKHITDNEDLDKVQKDFNKIYKKIKKNKKYFYSAKDLALLESLDSDGIKFPKELNFIELKKEYDVPENLLELAKNNEPAFLTLKLVEIVGEDEPYNLDPETIYFITHLLNQTNLKKLRDEFLTSALPLRS